MIYRNYENGSSLNFYTGEQVHILDGLRADLWFGSFFPDAPHVFEDYESFPRLWNGPKRVYFFAQEDSVEKALAGIDPKTVHVFARSGGKVNTDKPGHGDARRSEILARNISERILAAALLP